MLIYKALQYLQQILCLVQDFSSLHKNLEDRKILKQKNINQKGSRSCDSNLRQFEPLKELFL